MTGTERYEELDAARGIAILMMILFHTVFDLSFFRIWPVDVAAGFWRCFAFLTASLFLLIAGVSLTISHSRALQATKDGQPVRTWGKFLRRGTAVFACGLLVTFVTWLFLGEGFVVFGILHLIGISIIISPLFFRFQKYNILLGMVVITAGIAISALNITGPVWLVPFGIHPTTLFSVDYEPIFPWFGLILAGMGLGYRLYPDGRRAFPAPVIPARLTPGLVFLGRHSLIIYLAHQPIILLFLQVITGAHIFW